MKNLKAKAPALWAIFFDKGWGHSRLVEINPPSGCSDCPFASESEEVNPYSRDEGRYDCALLGKEKIWGEEPQCGSDDWRGQGQQEIEAIAQHDIRREIKEEKAKTLLNELFKIFSRQEQENDQMTIQEVKEKLFKNQDPEVIQIVESMIATMTSII